MVRLVTLARSLPRSSYEVSFASARFDERVFAGTDFERHSIRSISPEQADRRVRWGLRLYPERELQRYVDDDLRLVDRVRPDVIVGDLRWSLSVSGPVTGVKVVSIANAYWSPFAEREFPLPEHPIVRALGVRIASRHFERARAAAFRWFARPLDAMRERYGLPPLETLEAVLTWGDATLFADPPGLVELRALPESQRIVGPVAWAPRDGVAPDAELGRSRPLVYLTLGSSGSLRALRVALEGLGSMDVDVLLATAGRARALPLPANVRAASLVRGDLAAQRAAVVVCNGGASTAYQALAAGTPVVGLPMNLDQYLAMDAIRRAGAGLLLRSGTATPRQLREAVLRALGDPHLRAAAQRIAIATSRTDPRREFARAVERV